MSAVHSKILSRFKKEEIFLPRLTKSLAITGQHVKISLNPDFRQVFFTAECAVRWLLNLADRLDFTSLSLFKSTPENGCVPAGAGRCSML